MNSIARFVLLAAVLAVAYGCASYSACEYRRNVKNSGAERIGWQLDSNANYLDRHSVERHISMYRLGKLPVYGDSSGYKGFIFNESISDAVTWVIYDQDGVEMGSGRLCSVWYNREMTGEYNASYVSDSLVIPPGKYRVEFQDEQGYCYRYPFHVPSPVDKPHGKNGHWHVFFK
ncbi:MAG: hypothetical protein PHE24_00490 [Patescibacteria group bacterium]|nr:hypothetical protein [Patescibacteria group bacterium]